jgi:hypothetical protein
MMPPFLPMGDEDDEDPKVPTGQLGDNDSSYLLYMDKVPTGRGFVEDAPANIMLL